MLAHAKAPIVVLSFQVVAVLGSFSWSARAQINSIESVNSVARLTGPGAINNTLNPYLVGGTDLGNIVVHQNVTYFLFGDTFSCDNPCGGGFWRRNTMAYSADLDPVDGITFDGWITNGNGQARQIFSFSQPNDGTITEIPTAGVSVGNRMYVWFMAVNWWGPAGIWSISYAGLAYTENNGLSFTRAANWSLPSWTNFGMVAASTRNDLPPGVDDHIYIWGTPAGRLGGVKLARVPQSQITNLATYEYFGGLQNGQPTWVNSETQSPAIIPPVVGEMSVMYNAAARRWTALYINDQTPAGCTACSRIELRQSETPWGPWSEPLSVATAIQFPGLYGSYMHPRYVEQDGRTFYFTMSLWPSYDVYWMRVCLNVGLRGDLNNDAVIDQIDFSNFLEGMHGPSIPSGGTPCWAADFDADGDVDLADYAEFERILTNTAP